MKNTVRKAIAESKNIRVNVVESPIGIVTITKAQLTAKIKNLVNSDTIPDDHKRTVSESEFYPMEFILQEWDSDGNEVSINHEGTETVFVTDEYKNIYIS